MIGVTVLIADGVARYSPMDLEEWIHLAPEKLNVEVMPSGTFVVREDAEPQQQKLQLLLDMHTDFARTWDHKRPEFPSQSEYDLALATMALRAGMNEQDVVDLLVAHRRIGGGEIDVGELTRKYRYTLATARGSATPRELAIPDGAGSIANESLSMPPDSSPAAPRSEPTRAGPSWPAPPRPEAFHGLAGRFVRTIGPHTEADPVALLMQLLIGFGSAVDRAPHCRVGGARHGTNEFALLVGRTSKARKGTSWEDTRECLDRVDPTWVKNRIVHGLSSGEGLIWQVRDQIKVREKKKKGGGYEDVVKDAGVDDKRLLVIEGEFASTLRRMGMEGNSLSAVIRCAWDFGDLSTLVKNNPAKATGAHISLVGHITKDELLRELDRTEMGNGFANRILFVCVERSKCLPEGGCLTDAERNPIVAELNQAIRQARGTNELCRDPAAKKLWADVYPSLSEGKPGLLGAVIGRAEAHVLRLSLLYALLDRAKVITTEHLIAALSVWDYCERSASFIFGEALGDPFADEVLRVLRANPNGLAKAALYAAFGGHPSARKMDAALRLLLEKGLVGVASLPTGGRPSEVWSAKEIRKRDETSPAAYLSSLSSLSSQDRAPVPGGVHGPTSAPSPPGTPENEEPAVSSDELSEQVRREFDGEFVEGGEEIGPAVRSEPLPVDRSVATRAEVASPARKAKEANKGHG